MPAAAFVVALLAKSSTTASLDAYCTVKVDGTINVKVGRADGATSLD